MLKRRYVFPNVIEMNCQAGHRLGVNVYLIEDQGEFVLIDIGYDDVVDEMIELIRQMDFSLSKCKMLIATHADIDHAQGLARASEILKAPVASHEACADFLATGDTEMTFARIKAQEIDVPMPKIPVDVKLKEGDMIDIGSISLDVWSTPGHAIGQLAFKLRDLLFVGDNIYKDGSVGVIDAHHGSFLPDFIKSLKRVLADESKFLLPSHGPIFARDNEVIQATIDRLIGYQSLADFGTCASDWPLLDEWEKIVVEGRFPPDFEPSAEPLGAPVDPPKRSQRLPGALS